MSRQDSKPINSQNSNPRDFYDIVFVILVYRNTDDVQEMIDSINAKIDNSKIIIVNSYFDDLSRDVLQDIASDNNCDFINTPNEGYGHGNNQGIQFALESYDFNALIVANPDMIIKQFLLDKELLSGSVLLCPMITARDGKQQNPFWVVKNVISEWLMFLGHKHHNKLLVLSGIAINKAIRETFLLLFNILGRRVAKVYAAHGSFLIFSRDLLLELSLPFDENMFLFSEEMYLARRLRARRVSTYILKDLQVLHKEDGSMSTAKIDQSSENTKSYLYYYDIRKQLDKEG